MKEERINKHKRRFRIYNIVCIVLSIVISYFLYKFMDGWARGDGQYVPFTSRQFFIMAGVAFGFYVSMLLPGFLLHKILVMKERLKK